MGVAGSLLVLAAMVAGLAGTVVPGLPGLALIWAAALVFGLVDGFGPIGAAAFTLITVLAVGGTVAKYVLSHRAGAGAAASWSTMALATVLGVVGFFVVPVVGFPLGLVAGVALAQQRRTRDWAVTWRATLRILRSFGVGVAIEVAAGLAMIVCWAAWAALTA